MKKLLMTISPFFVILCVFYGLVYGFQGALIAFGSVFIAFILIVIGVKWADFVEEHFDD